MFVSGCGKSEEEYKKASVTINHEDFARNPDNFNGKSITFADVVQNVKENGKETELLFLGNPPMLVQYKLKDGEDRIVEHDFVRVWGEYQKVSSKKIGDFSPETSVIEIKAEYISRPKWSFLREGFGYNSWTVKEDGNANPLDTKSLQLSLAQKKLILIVWI